MQDTRTRLCSEVRHARRRPCGCAAMLACARLSFAAVAGEGQRPGSVLRAKLCTIPASQQLVPEDCCCAARRAGAIAREGGWQTATPRGATAKSCSVAVKTLVGADATSKSAREGRRFRFC